MGKKTKEKFDNRDLYIIKMQVTTNTMVQNFFLSSKLTRDAVKEESTFVNYSTDEPIQCSVNCVVSYLFLEEMGLISCCVLCVK